MAQLKPGQQAVLGYGILGHEWNEDLDNGFRPAGLMRMSETTVNNLPYTCQATISPVYAAGTATITSRSFAPERRAGLQRRHRAVDVGARSESRH